MSKISTALTIGQVAETIGVSTHTLRYYEQAGLIREVGRTQAGHRLYSPADLDWLRFVMRLKATGMPIAGMQAFAALRARGQPTMGARRDQLVAHRDAVLGRIAELQSNLGAIVDKIAYYEAAARNGGADEPTRRGDATASLSHSDKDAPWTTHKTTATPGAGTS
ncbi:MerR family transcriptional regulator [Paraburkholderia sp. RAU2J]|uniref:MerR family transcriptional regulator n=1 Tax=Paraburkholderia sp. RAU2J TaxID=1938810 RepID=UPI000F29492C|nr:MerR family transcriptional regulator [Paraburkholderia sp. RAU2J]RKT27364.1 MerR family transcriptional regulator [Paraburkholderia sp. RAU2J]